MGDTEGSNALCYDYAVSFLHASSKSSFKKYKHECKGYDMYIIIKYISILAIAVLLRPQK